LFDARPAYLAAAYQTIDATWGGTEPYLRDGLNLTSDTLDRLRDRMLV
ncbi:MAG TPA: tyrosine-protein phosphatase, partial [Streptomyces sp.]|nr:tyrosine-protein phosphatase [Streptomyces sp.]